MSPGLPLSSSSQSWPRVNRSIKSNATFRPQEEEEKKKLRCRRHHRQSHFPATIWKRARDQSWNESGGKTWAVISSAKMYCVRRCWKNVPKLRHDGWGFTFFHRSDVLGLVWTWPGEREKKIKERKLNASFSLQLHPHAGLPGVSHTYVDDRRLCVGRNICVAIHFPWPLEKENKFVTATYRKTRSGVWVWWFQKLRKPCSLSLQEILRCMFFFALSFWFPKSEFWSLTLPRRRRRRVFVLHFPKVLDVFWWASA